MNCKSVLFSGFLALSLSIGTAFAATQVDKTSTNLEWKVQHQWNLPESPRDIVHSLDGKYVFILTQEHNVLIYTPEGKLEGSVPVEEGVTAIDIAPRAEMLYLIDGKKNTFSILSIDFIRDINISGSPVKGPADAPITIVLFTDFECPYCRKIEPLIAQVQERNAKNVKVVFKNMPLQFHKFADPAAKAALAADVQGKFWEFHDELFASEKLSDSLITDIAEKLGLDMDKWKKDKGSSTTQNRINIDIQDAQKAGVTGTPTIFINGRLLKNRSMQGFQQMINAELKKK